MKERNAEKAAYDPRALTWRNVICKEEEPMKKITGVFVNAKEHCATVKEIENDLQGFRALLGVDWIDIASRQIGGTYYDIVCDDEALLKEDPVVSMADPEGRPLLCGNLFIVNYDGHGNESSLTEEDVNRILGAMVPALSLKHGITKIMVGDY